MHKAATILPMSLLQFRGICHLHADMSCEFSFNHEHMPQIDPDTGLVR